MRFNFLRLILLMLFAVPGALPLWAQDAALSPESEVRTTAPVVIDGETLFQLVGISSLPAQERAELVRQRIIDAAHDPSFNTADLRVDAQDKFHVIMAGNTRILGLVELDARTEGVSLGLLAAAHRNRIANAIDEYRADRGTDRLLRNGVFALGATIILLLALWGVLRLFSLLHGWAERKLQTSLGNLADKAYNLFHAGRVWQILAGTLRLLRLVLIIALLYFYLNAVLGLFPWTRPFALVLFSLVLDPLKALGSAFIGALPNLFFLVFLVIAARYLLKLIHAFFRRIELGRIRFENFDDDWAMPTYKIVRVLVIIVAVVIAYPYIPGSNSLAFKGLSVFIGVLLSLGSSSFIANTIAGLTMTYRGAFKVGDVVRIGDVVGRIEDIKLMVTRVRTPKNETVVMPNSNILNTDVVNFSTQARQDGLIVHTTVGIGYDVPWRQVEALLLKAAERTAGLRSNPPPFVLQKALGDFTVDYELNAFCESEKNLPKLHSDLHANIQDAFNEEGVQIMSPHYVADPETPKIAPVNDRQP